MLNAERNVHMKIGSQLISPGKINEHLSGVCYPVELLWSPAKLNVAQRKNIGNCVSGHSLLFRLWLFRNQSDDWRNSTLVIS